MSRPLIPAADFKRKPFFGDLPPVAAASLLLLLGLAAVTTFYASVFAAAHAIAADNGGGREMFAPVTLWVCALFVLQGLVPVLRFSFSELPRLVAAGIKGRAVEAGIFVLLLIAGALLLLT